MGEAQSFTILPDCSVTVVYSSELDQFRSLGLREKAGVRDVIDGDMLIESQVLGERIPGRYWG